MAVPAVREDLRRIANVRNALSVVGLWASTVALIGVTVWSGNPLVYAVTFLLMGPMFARFAILGHEAAHRLLFSSKRWNDFVGRWLLAYPAFVPIDAYRRSHIAHHKDEFGPNEPDLDLYNGYPITRVLVAPQAAPRRASATPDGRTSRPLLRALPSKTARPFACASSAPQVVLFAVRAAHRAVVALPAAVARRRG